MYIHVKLRETQRRNNASWRKWTQVDASERRFELRAYYEFRLKNLEKPSDRRAPMSCGAKREISRTVLKYMNVKLTYNHCNTKCYLRRD